MWGFDGGALQWLAKGRPTVEFQSQGLAWAAANRVGADPRLFCIVVATMASTSFLTPIGYQTNTMVYGPGGYRFTDYPRLGAPLTLAVIATILVVARVWYGL